jgi:hypothetical protein
MSATLKAGTCVTNEVTGWKIAITTHASERWAERISGNMHSELATAVPFGGQYGEGQLLLAKCGAVFVLIHERGNKYVCRTVLTKAQAMVNMESRITRRHAEEPITAAVAKESKKAIKARQEGALQDAVIAYARQDILRPASERTRKARIERFKQSEFGFPGRAWELYSAVYDNLTKRLPQ